MKKCPYCAEEIRDEAIKCRYCGASLPDAARGKWYHKTSALVMAFMSFGPFALPLLWANPRYSARIKVIGTVLVLVGTYFLIVVLDRSLRVILNHYQTMLSL